MPKKQPVKKTTSSITEEQLAQLREIMPQVFSEGKVDFEKLHASLGDFGTEAPERYSFSWAGKRDAIKILQTPSRATLIPARKESIDFDKTQNIFIEGDNLEVLKLLYKPYFGAVKMIYIDPPYNTGNDFVYPDNFADPLDTYLKLTGQKDSEGNLLTSNAETSGRYHSAWLSMMYPRLFLARQLLREDGVIFISIDDNEVYDLRMMMNEVFGEENFVSMSIWQRKYSPQNDDKGISALHEYVIVYARDKSYWLPNLLDRTETNLSRYKNPDNDPRGPWKAGDLTSKTKAAGHSYPITSPTGKFFKPKGDRQWAPSQSTFNKWLSENRIWFGMDGNNVPSIKQFLSEVQKGTVPTSLWLRDLVGDNQEAVKQAQQLEISFDSPKPSKLIRHMLKIGTKKDLDDIVLDFFSGSATTAQAVLELNREDGGNRKFILVQLPEPIPSPPSPLPKGEGGFSTIAEIGKERIRRVIKKMKKEREGQLKLDKPEDLGFKVFKLTESNYKGWDDSEQKDPKAYAKQMEMLNDPLVKGWKEEDVIYEVAVKEGYGLNIVIENLTGLYRVTDPDKEQSFYISLAEKVKLKDVKSLNLKKDDLFICRDIALDDETAANLSLQCRLKTI